MWRHSHYHSFFAENSESMWKKVLLVIVIIIGLLVYRYSTIPFIIRQEIIPPLPSRYYSFTSISMEGFPVDTAYIKSAKIYRGFFSIDQYLDLQESKTLLKVLCSPVKESLPPDNMNAEASFVINYYNSDDLLLGFSYFRDGQISTFLPRGSTDIKDRHLTGEELEIIDQL